MLAAIVFQGCKTLVLREEGPVESPKHDYEPSSEEEFIKCCINEKGYISDIGASVIGVGHHWR